MKIEKKVDNRRKYYLVLDCETATLPCSSDYDENARKSIAIAKPLIYDIAWQVFDRKGNIYRKKSYLIAEIFSVPSIFDTAYYKEKRPIYLERLAKGETEIVSWKKAMEELESDMELVESVGAYNSMFDFKKAIPFTELYINELYSTDYNDWYEKQKKNCDIIASGKGKKSLSDFDKDVFRFRGKEYVLFDVWGLSCEHILNTEEYKNKCIENGWITESGKYYKTSAETCYRYYKEEIDFEEKHCAIDDTEIETEIYVEILKRTKCKAQNGIIYFPFRILGRADE